MNVDDVLYFTGMVSEFSQFCESHGLEVITNEIDITTANNIDLTSPFHVSDHQHDILNKESGNIYLDYNNDDYYNHSIDGCFDLRNSKYLIENN